MVVRASRVMTGLVGRNVELNDDELGFIASDELNPQKSRVLLSLALLKKPTAAQVQTMFRALLRFPPYAPAPMPISGSTDRHGYRRTYSGPRTAIARSRKSVKRLPFIRTLLALALLAGASPVAQQPSPQSAAPSSSLDRRHDGGRRSRPPRADA